MTIEQLTSKEWRTIPTYEGLYEVTDNGMIRAFARSGSSGRILKQHLSKGYSRVFLSKKNITKGIFTHRVVLMAFNRLSRNGEVCNHIDGNRANNHISNLEWCTRKENERHKQEVLGENSKGIKNGKYGYKYSKIYPFEKIRNQLCKLGITRCKHNLAENDDALPEKIFFENKELHLVIFKTNQTWEYCYMDMLAKIIIRKISEKQANAGAMLRIWLLENKLIEV